MPPWLTSGAVWAEFESKANKFRPDGRRGGSQQSAAAGGRGQLVRPQGALPESLPVDYRRRDQYLKERSGALQDSFQILDMAFQKQALLLSSTPSIFPVRGLMGNGYGWRRDPFTGMRDFHEGLDIVAPVGTRVSAPADGIVTRVGPSADSATASSCPMATGS